MSRRLSLLPALILSLLLALLCPFFAGAQAKPVDAEGHQWWQHAVFYEIYPRSFADSNNDGIGDLNDFLTWRKVNGQRLSDRRKYESVAYFQLQKCACKDCVPAGQSEIKLF